MQALQLADERLGGAESEMQALQLADERLSVVPEEPSVDAAASADADDKLDKPK